MNLDRIRSPLLDPARPIDAEAATEILRMLTSDRIESLAPCRADGTSPADRV